MTTIAFAPPQGAAFTFNATLDGGSYACRVWWNIYGQRWYLTVTDGSGNVVITTALIGSTIDYPINLIAFVFTTSSLVFLETSQTIVIAP